MSRHITNVTSASEDHGARYDRHSDLTFLIYCVACFSNTQTFNSRIKETVS